jgi:hypothetical protein
VAAPVENHGVIMFVDMGHLRDGRVFLYKHAQRERKAP